MQLQRTMHTSSVTIRHKPPEIKLYSRQQYGNNSFSHHKITEQTVDQKVM